MSIDLSCVILARNEEKNIGRAIKSADFCDEIIVIDDCSTDQTVEIAKELGAIVCERRLEDDFAGQRNFGLGRAGGDWVFFVDADEEVTAELKHEILNSKFNQKSITAYYIRRRDVFWGRKLRFGETGGLKLIRLVKKNSGRWQGKVHETFKTDGYAGDLKNVLIHHPHPTVKAFLAEINRYSSLRAQELFAQKRETNIFEIIFFPLGKFILNYFIRLGFLDGASGFVYAFMMSFHSFLVRSKLYTINHSSFS